MPTKSPKTISVLLRVSPEEAAFIDDLALQLGPPGLAISRQDVLRTTLHRLRTKMLVLASPSQRPTKKLRRNR